MNGCDDSGLIYRVVFEGRGVYAEFICTWRSPTVIVRAQLLIPKRPLQHFDLLYVWHVSHMSCFAHWTYCKKHSHGEYTFSNIVWFVYGFQIQNSNNSFLFLFHWCYFTVSNTLPNIQFIFQTPCFIKNEAFVLYWKRLKSDCLSLCMAPCRDR